MESDEARRLDVARRWLSEFQACVRAVDFERARGYFADDVVAFGTHAEIVAGRDGLERDQWRHVWPRIRDFSFRLSEVRCLGDDGGLVAIVPWSSRGMRADGSSFARPGRATVILTSRNGRWLAVHTHFSLAPT
ncbi:MAG: YybH family protein [Chloroflexota bacterium]